ncbi:hypothetical protein A2962_01425 [Candidatus Woesebacteria bacterium RIFCSPLOWO2_01_FULL_39_61]|uniref:N-acetyltransferase domain-containing protein n=1 Tax=Candidatus Woesebacteria bacterium RIFCSPHIGHO2_02_FULL_39_13 TaxID=1802505 RepID=A0A1F7Z4Z1_9BACT|nr:MAG: hypothetical protein A2692_01665 [Candidatus Woesebacteria bacterium RIFCSPHIGHO2_01_FULL_39_95]OGM34510.1 MAG: hypothetical protein A3D01_03120 [Candidatus Woesebacteria bacterium RIFCSPHIGHO2_02_FULL_39_13]OGM38777.1 MAG: hypothetical protein A3E13_01010 [Candidatus Woesebacteria bacterium RIFCSPHIGHO2_12_FULL_40_20]OGM65783.1 MAG: hypothetical protein A2962_01425 [Candidatus Woesebacteria bacterium RIFCSPLOWO2_01_FULL_39_61]OGM73856.1 MAG: hypothetical protein A3H19_04270 [Candidatus
MRTELFNVNQDIEPIEAIARKAFSATPDSSVEQWFSFTEMVKAIHEEKGACVLALSDDNEILGMTYAQQENPINGNEGIEKWVIVIAAVNPEHAGKGVGSKILGKLEEYAHSKGARKMFVYTNKGDDGVVNFYKKNGYEDAGWIKDYQYGKGNSAVFLLKYLEN